MPHPLIAFDLTPLQNAHRFRGIGTYVRGLASRLAAQTEIALEFWAWSGPLDIQINPPHQLVATRRFPMPEYRGAWFFARIAMRWRALRSEVHAVHVTDPNALTLLPGRTLMSTAYDLIPLKDGVERLRPIARAGYRSYLKTLRRVDTIFAISEQTAGDLHARLHVPASRIKLARPGIDLPAAGSASIAPNHPYFLFLGGPNPNKNLAIVLDAMRLAPDLHEELIVGGYWLPSQLEALDREIDSRGLHGRVHHVGFVPSAALVDLLQRSTAVIVPSLQEGFGLPVAEGLAAGALVVHSSIPVLEEISEGAALTFDPGSHEGLAECLRRTSDEALSREVRRRGLARARKLTWDAAVDETLAVYRSALRN